MSRVESGGLCRVITLYDAAVAEADQGLQADSTEDGDTICSLDKYQAICLLSGVVRNNRTYRNPMLNMKQTKIFFLRGRCRFTS